ncbi:MAG: hypothetical protein M3R53_05830 [Candidatus Eremiobacteraeota bacterium]|nr:hypothetical protein [Candidatus Eremiobacteraeota bacterium]
MYKFIRASQSGDVNCLVKGSFSSLVADDGSTLESLFDGGWKIAGMTHLDTGFILIALHKG